MKARCWYEAKLPLYELDESCRKDFEITVEQCVNAASLVKNYLVSALKQAWFERPGDIRGDFSFIDLTLWQNTEIVFYVCLRDFADGLQAKSDKSAIMNQIKGRWHKALVNEVLILFDQWAMSSAFEYENPHRIATAYNTLKRQLWGKKLRETTLELPLKGEQQSQQEEQTDATATVV
jgi:CRISPR system Cascade subunit CasA